MERDVEGLVGILERSRLDTVGKNCKSSLPVPLTRPPGYCFPWPPVPADIAVRVTAGLHRHSPRSVGETSHSGHSKNASSKTGSLPVNSHGSCGG